MTRWFCRLGWHRWQVQEYDHGLEVAFWHRYGRLPSVRFTCLRCGKEEVWNQREGFSFWRK